MAQFSKEEIEKYRADYQAEVRRINSEPGGKPLTQSELDEALNGLSDMSIKDLIRQQVPPETRAHIQMYYN